MFKKGKSETGGTRIIDIMRRKQNDAIDIAINRQIDNEESNNKEPNDKVSNDKEYNDKENDDETFTYFL